MSPTRPHRITSRQNPLVSRFRAAAASRRDSRSGVLVEGSTLMDEARRAGWELELAAFTDAALETDPRARELAAVLPPTRVMLVSGSLMDAISPVRSPSGSVALARPRAAAEEAFYRPAPALVVLAIDVQDPGNLGAIVRAAEAAGATGVFACGSSADPWSWKAVRGAMGSAFRVPLARSETNAALGRVRARGIRLLAAMGQGGTPLDEADLTGPVALVLGSEGRGLPEALAQGADARISIPMAAPVESLNVAVAAGVVLYEVRRQRASGRSPAGPAAGA